MEEGMQDDGRREANLILSDQERAGSLHLPSSEILTLDEKGLVHRANALPSVPAVAHNNKQLLQSAAAMLA